MQRGAFLSKIQAFIEQCAFVHASEDRNGVSISPLLTKTVYGNTAQELKMPVFCEERKNSSHAVILKCFHLFWAHIQLPQHNKDITQSWSRIWTTIYFEHPWTTVAKKKINKYFNPLLNITLTVARLCTVSQISKWPMTSLKLIIFYKVSFD